MNTSIDENIKSFENPSGYWQHQGAFSVELTKDASMNFVPFSAIIDGQKVIVNEGRIKQVMGAFSCIPMENHFTGVIGE